MKRKLCSMVLTTAMLASTISGNTVALADDNSHIHTDDCYEAKEELTCNKIETDGHHHTSDCYEDSDYEDDIATSSNAVKKELICDAEEAEEHHHTDKCYKKVKTLICNEETDEVEEKPLDADVTTYIDGNVATNSNIVVQNVTGTLQVTGSGAVCNDGVWELTDGSYTVTGTASPGEYIKVNGDVELVLDDITIENNSSLISEYAPAISIVNNSNVMITLQGTNKLQGSLGYAGIYVEEGSELTIDGDGKMYVKGGDTLDKSYQKENGINYSWCGGSGIGGNGVWMNYSQNDKWLDNSTPNFGTVIIESGTIITEGGGIAYKNSGNEGAGSGIGSGGASTKYWSNEEVPNIEGHVEINGGHIEATGGHGAEWSLTGGGAGIGSGGSCGNFYTHNSNVEVTINNGTVIANGVADGAGIGGGANVNGGTIHITGGKITANGGYEIDNGVQDGGYGGAGIGGGDNGGVVEINISGGEIIAKATGAAAGIGGGNDSLVGVRDWDDNVTPGTIVIQGDAKVQAYGGSYKDGVRDGGAGIGSGRSYSYDNGCGSIYILDKAEVQAYAGAKANAIGVGTYYGGDGVNYLKIDDTVKLWAQTKDDEYPALLNITQAGNNPIDYDSQNTYLVKNDTNNTDKSVGQLNVPDGATKEFEYSIDNNKLSIDGNIMSDVKIVTPLGNWATIYKNKQININYVFTGEVPTEAIVPSVDTVEPNTNYSVKNVNTVDGWKFTGWFIDKACTIPFENNSVLGVDTTLYGYWALESTPITNTKAAYRVGYYKEQLDGSYALAETDFPLYGEIGSEVTAPSKTFDNYYEDITNSNKIESGTVVIPTSENNELKTLVLRRYYNLNRYNITYDLNGGTNDKIINTIVKHGQSIKLSEAPYKNGVIFSGWTDGVNTYKFGDTIEIRKDTVLKAVWSSKSSGGHSSSNSGGHSSAQADSNWSLVNADTNTWNYTINGEKVKNQWKYLRNPYAKDGQPQSSWFRFDKNGDMVHGWYFDKDTGDWYKLHNKTDGILGSMITGWHKDEQDNRWYYLDPSTGKMLTGWQKIDDKWYYLNAYAPNQTYEYVNNTWVYKDTNSKPFGSMYENEKTPDGYVVDQNGVWIEQ